MQLNNITTADDLEQWLDSAADTVADKTAADYHDNGGNPAILPQLALDHAHTQLNAAFEDTSQDMALYGQLYDAIRDYETAMLEDSRPQALAEKTVAHILHTSVFYALKTRLRDIAVHKIDNR